MSIVSILILLLFASFSLFFYTRRDSIFRYVPAALLIGIATLAGAHFMDPNDSIEAILQHWSGLPALLINVVFACLFLGHKLFGLRKIWEFAGPQVVFGQVLAWGQYVVGSLLALLVLVPVFNMNPLAGALIEISFEGGHGTAAGLIPLFNELGFSEGSDIALGMATVGIAIGLLNGLVLHAVYSHKNRKKSKRKLKVPTTQKPLIKAFAAFMSSTHNSYFARHRLARTIVQIGLVAASIGLGYLLRLALLLFESTFIAAFTDIRFVAFIPLFPLAMIGGILVQYLLTKLGREHIVHVPTIAFIGGVALEIVIITAIATMSLTAISDNGAAFLSLIVAGSIWNIVAFLLLAPRIMGRYWFERGIGDYGQSMGMTATGLLLMRVADPKNKAHALERFGYKQLLFEPIVGGGLFTAMSMIIIFEFGLPFMIGLTLFMLIFWLLIGRVFFYDKK